MLPEVINEYYKVYHMNLALLNERYPIKFVSLHDIEFDGRSNDIDIVAKNTNLTESIREFGTYWLIMCDESYNLIEGRHRIPALLNDEELKNKKLPCLITNDTNNFKPRDSSLYFYSPISFLYDFYPHVPSYEVCDFNPRIAKVYIEPVHVWIKDILRIAHKLAPQIYLHSESYGAKFYGSLYLNDEEMFKQMIKEGIKNEYIRGFEDVKQFYDVRS
jgi:hypothetical protein